MFLLFLLIIVFISVFCWKHLRRRFTVPISLVVTIISWLILIKGFGVVENFNLAIKLKPFDVVVNGIEQFRQDRGYYPSKLEDITPEYVQSLPALPDIGVDEIEYDSHWSKRNGWLFIGEKRPTFLFGFWGSGGVLGSDTIIRYCPKQYDCRYQTDVSVKKDEQWVSESQIFEPKRINDSWVKIINY